VAEADKAGYDMPTVIWVRERNMISKTLSDQPVFKESKRRSEEQWPGDGKPSVSRMPAWSQGAGTENEGRRGTLWQLMLNLDSAGHARPMLSEALEPRPGTTYSSESQRAAVFAARLRRSADNSYRSKSDLEGSRRQDSAGNVSTGTTAECTECTVSWYDVMERLLESFRDPYVNPFTGEKGIMKGDIQSCAVNGCEEYSIVSNSIEIYEATIGLWNRLGYRTNSTSLAWHFELYGRTNEFNETAFRVDLAVVLRHVAPSDVIIVKGPTQSQPPLIMEPEQADAGCVPPACYTGFSGSSSGIPNYQPKSNKGYFYLSIVIIGPSQRSVSWAQDNIRSTESILDNTAIKRRTHFIRKWRVLWLAEDVCLPDTERLDPVTKEPVVVCRNRTIDLFASTYSSPEYQCPQNLYQDSSAGRCRACASETTSATGSTDVIDCFSCQPSIDEETSRWKYTYLKCDGKGCNQCPANTLSSPGALSLTDCIAQPSITMTLKGPSDQGYTTEPVTAHRAGRPFHPPFDAQRLRHIVSILTNVPLSRVALEEAKDVWNFSSTRCAQLRGGCMFDVDVKLQAENGPQLLTAIQRISGDECHGMEPTDGCPNPDVNKTAIYGRSLLLQEFEILQIKEVLFQGRDTGECPDRYEGGTEKLLKYIDIFKESGKGGIPFVDADVVGVYACPNKFYRSSGGYCQPCPDMTTSNKGAMSLADCAAFNTIIISAKDASLTYEARTNEEVDGYRSAQPNALTLNDGAKAYLKIRGYALHPDEWSDPDDENAGRQIDKCEEGLNCFNESRFREDLSALVGTVTPNEVRLVKPNTCLFENQATRFDGLRRTLAPSVAKKSLCGPWPGLPPTPGKCVCNTVFSVEGETSLCYYTNGPAMVAKYLGESADSPTVMQGVGTVGACAKLAGVGGRTNAADAFLYHPGKMLCSPRTQISKIDLAIDECSSHSKICRDLIQFFNPLVNAAVFEPGMQMYYLVDELDYKGRCRVLVEDSSCPNSDRKLQQPLDTHYYYINLHAETKSDLEHAMGVLQNARTSNQRSAFEEFLAKYQVTDVAISPDKSLIAAEVSSGREGSLRAAGNIDGDVPILFESGAICESQGTTNLYSPAACMVGDSPDAEQAEAICRFDMARLPPAVIPTCRDGASPQCLAFSAQPTCEYAKRVFDEQTATFQPMPCHDAPNGQPLCTSTTVLFRTTVESTPDATVCGPEETNYLCTTRPGTMLVTRVDIALAQDTFSWAAGQDARLLLSFTDGSDQSITLQATNGKWSYYIRPVVTRTVTVRALPRQDSVVLKIAEVDVHGQDMAAIFSAESYLNLFAPTGTSEPFACPATTFFTSHSAIEDSKKIYSGCSICPYPKTSNIGSMGSVNCTCAICGDGRVSWQQDEQCDDGNLEVNDGCAQNCEIEALQLCQGEKTERGVGLPLLSYSQRDTCFRLGSAWTRYGLAPWSARYGHRYAFLNLLCHVL